METRSKVPSPPAEPRDDLPPAPSDDDIDLSEEDTDTVDDLPVATDRHPHVMDQK